MFGISGVGHRIQGSKISLNTLNPTYTLAGLGVSDFPADCSETSWFKPVVWSEAQSMGLCSKRVL